MPRCILAGYSYKYIGERFGVSRQRGFQLVIRGLLQLRRQLLRNIRHMRFYLNN